jgi:quercetin 2,3-dioxygenase
MPQKPTAARTTRSTIHHPCCSNKNSLPLALLLLLLFHSPLVTRSFLVVQSIHPPAHNKQPHISSEASNTDSSSSCPSSSSSALFLLSSSSPDNTECTVHQDPSLSTTATTTPPAIMGLPHYRSIRRILSKPHPHWVGDGFKVLPVFANLAFTEQVSPFLMFDYGEPQTFDPQVAGAKPHGVGQHPHRGFETVTIAFQGEVEHHDSVGHHGIVGPGDVQWMTAGRGIVHEEYHSKEFAKKGGTLEMCQLWVNLKAKDKMTPPKYQEILSSNIPVVQLKGRTADSEGTEEKVGSARVIAGELLGTKGSASTFSPIQVWDVSLPHVHSSIELPFPSDHNCIVFVRRGSVQVLTSAATSSNGATKKDGVLGPQDVAILDSSSSSSSTSSVVALRVLEPNTSVLVLGGEPFGEPIANHGPFVMNTQEQIREAFADYRSGRLGQ